MAYEQAAVPALARLLAEPLRWRLACELASSDRRVRELVAAVGQPQNLVSYHLRQLRDGGLVAARRSSHDARDTYYRLDLPRCAEALAAAAVTLHPALALAVAPPAPPRYADHRTRRVLFLCTGNSSRSPMAAALLRHQAGPRVHAVSAGSRPKPLHHNAVRVMRERYGIDVSGHRPTHIDSQTGRRFDYVISLCDKVREVCPDFPGRPELVHWSVPDPTAARGRAGYPAFVRTAAELDARIRYLIPVLART